MNAYDYTVITTDKKKYRAYYGLIQKMKLELNLN